MVMRYCCITPLQEVGNFRFLILDFRLNYTRGLIIVEKDMIFLAKKTDAISLLSYGVCFFG